MPLISASKLITIDRHIIEQQNRYPDATGDFTNLLHDLMFAMRIIASEVRKAGLTDILGLTENTNVHGEQVRKIDEFANHTIFRAMDHGGNLCAMLSEEFEEVIQIPEQFEKGKYILAFDPIDGSSNIDVNVTIGTIFSLYKRLEPNDDGDASMEDVLQPGYKQEAAGYVIYGSATNLVYTTGHGVNVFTYEASIGEFILTNENLKMPEFASYYSCNEGNAKKWSDNLQRYVEHIKTPNEENKPYSLRYIATAAADIHRLIHYGGIYMYPEEKNKPDGKIRLMYEANPLAMIVEQAGGRAITGKQRILDVVPEKIHQRVPFYIGSKKNIEELERFLEG